MTQKGVIVPLDVSMRPHWLPIVHRLNIVSFTFALIFYLGGFWGGVISLFISQRIFVECIALVGFGGAMAVLSYHLTLYECSFHDHI